MKKNLAVRAGAIAVVLMVAFFSILPEFVNAEGDDPKPLAESELAAETSKDDITDGLPAIDAADGEEPGENAGESDLPDLEIPDETTPDVDVPDTEIENTETPDTETPDTETPDTEEPSEDSSEKEDPKGDGSEKPEEPGTENPGTQTPPEQNPEDSAADSQPGDNNQPPAGSASGVMDTVEDYLALLDESQISPEKRTSIQNRLETMDMEEIADKFNSDEKDFVIDGTTVTGYTGAGGYIKIPDQITAIGDGAFAGNNTILVVSFPGALQSIGSSAFNGCTNLEAVAIPDSVTSVGDSAFANCTALANVSIGAGTGTIVSNEFNNCSSLQSVAVPEGISSIGAGAFGNCANLGSISLPSTLASLDRNAFAGDVNLASISVASGSYSSYDGCVYTADGSQLLLCPQGKTGIAFSPEMAAIASGAFSGCGYLLSAVVPDATDVIEANAFSGSAIQSVTIPTGVTSIGSQAGWVPNVVFGYSGSTAEKWANDNHYVFESLNGSNDENGTPIEDEHIEDPEGGQNSGDVTQTGSNTPGVNASSSASGSGQTAAISRNAGNRNNASTPKTGVEDYGIYFLFASIFLIGVGLFAYSRKLRLDHNR